MDRYGRDYGAPRGRGSRGYDLRAARAVARQVGEEAAFLRERAAPGEGYGGFPRPFGTGRRHGTEWQPDETPSAGDLMTESPAAVTPASTLEEAARAMRDLDVGLLPVVDDLEGRRLRGVITDRDITVRAVAAGADGTARVGDHMTAGVRACHPDDRVRDLVHVMERERIRRVPIVDHAGSLVGIVAQADLAVDFARGAPHREIRVEGAIERISEPARPRRGRGRGG